MILKCNHPALKRIAVFYLFFSALNLFAQGWQWQNPLPQGNRLGEIQFVDSLHGWIRAEGNTILRTTDSGRNWREEIIAQNNDSVYFQRIYFIDRLKGWAVGSGAPPVIMRTRDGGKKWESMPLPAERNNGNYYNFYGLYFLDALNGFITDGFGSIFHTMDGGYTWVRQRVPPLPPYEIRSIWFVNSCKGWAVGERKFLSTMDGGQTWVQHDSLASSENTRVVFQDSLNGWVLSKFYVFRTANGGTTWKVHAIDSNAVARRPDPVWGDFYSKEIMFLDPDQGWIATSWGIYSSTDSGKTWVRINQDNGYEGIWFTDTKHGCATGGKAYAVINEINNQIFETIDGGTSYQSMRMIITNKTLLALDFIDAMTGWAVGVDGTILHTKDGGRTWIHQTSPSASWLKRIVFLDKNSGWIVGYGGTILHTQDGGHTWQRQISGTNYALVEASFIDNQKGWVVGWSLDANPIAGIVLHTRNGGLSWKDQTPPGIGRLFGVAFIDSLHGWIATGGGTIGDDGKLYYTLDGGETWIIQVDKPDDAFGRIVFVDSFHGWVAGYYSILRTRDSGRTWEVKAPAMRVESLTNLQFADRSYGWAVGTRGDITHTIDGGETWVAQQSKTNLPLSDVDFVDERTGWAVGIFGTILQTETGGVTSLAEPSNLSPPPSRFELYQNYPNPFNAQTILTFRLYQSHAEVSIDIYNLLGQLVKTLFFNDTLAAGYHHVTWDGTAQNGKSVESGVYLYQLQVDDQKKVGKMIVLK